MNLYDFKKIFKEAPELFTAREYLESLILQFQDFGFKGTPISTLYKLKELDRECIAFSGWQTWRIHDKNLYDFDYEVVHEHGFRASMVSAFRNSEEVRELFKNLNWDIESLLNLNGEGELDLTLRIKVGNKEIQLNRGDILFFYGEVAKWYHITKDNTNTTRISKAEANRVLKENPRLFNEISCTEFATIPQNRKFKYEGI